MYLVIVVVAIVVFFDFLLAHIELLLLHLPNASFELCKGD